MAQLVQAVIEAAEQTGGLVDGTLADEIEAAGYGADLGASLPLALSLRLAPPRRPAGPPPRGRPRRLAPPRRGAAPGPGARRRALRLEDGVLHRPPGVAIDGGGLAKGLFGDLIAAELEGTFGGDCAGDVRL